MASSRREKYSIRAMVMATGHWFTLPASRYRVAVEPPSQAEPDSNATADGETNMKRIFLLASIGVGSVVLIFALFSGSSAARAPENYPLVCRGGGSLVTGIAPGERNIGFTFPGNKAGG